MDGKKVGFSPSTCKYEDFGERVTSQPTFQPSRQVQSPNVPSEPPSCQRGLLYPIDECSAFCNEKNSSVNYVAEGTQRWADKCIPPTKEETRNCHVSCSVDNRVISAQKSILCPADTWTECTRVISHGQSSCQQSRLKKNPVSPGGACAKSSSVEQRSCYAGSCPVSSGIYLN